MFSDRMSYFEQATSLLASIPSTVIELSRTALTSKAHGDCCSHRPTVIAAATVTETMSHAVVRIAGLSGASAVIIGAYGAHALRESSVDERRKAAFDTASRYHLLHSVALLGASRARFPLLTSTLLAAGILVFCGPIYHYSITGNESIRKYTPVGGILFIIGWLSFIL